jgi:hypothetical protein
LREVGVERSGATNKGLRFVFHQLLMRRTIWQGCQISPLFHQDDQDDQINLIDHLGWWGVGVFLAAEARPASRQLGFDA